MFNRPLLFLGVLTAAIVVPYVLLDENLAQTARTQLNRLWGKAEAKGSEALARLMAEGGSLTPVSAQSPAVEEAFRFEITPQWVTSHWPRVSTVAGDTKQLGMRVPLVSGTRSDDIAGSLTYYFDEYHQLQRITFNGLTGDARRLLAATVTAHGLKSLPTTGAAHYIAGDRKNPTSEVIVKLLPIVRSDAEHARQEVTVDLRRGSLLSGDRNTSRDPEPSLIPSSFRKW